MPLSAAARASRLMRLWQRLNEDLMVGRATAPGPGTKARGIGTLSDVRLRDLGFQRDQVGGSVTFAKGGHQRLF